MHRKNSLIVPYPMIAFVLLCVAVLLIAWTFKVNATTSDSYNVNAQVNASTPVVPPDITYPVDGAELFSTPIDVSGTCQTNTYIEIFDNNLMEGSALCTGSGTFQLQVNLFPGANQLIADSFNLTNNPGPNSSPVNVTYNAPAVVQSPVTASPSSGSSSHRSSSPSPRASAISLTTNFLYQGYFTGQTVQWHISISGGIAPYAINISWGDGTTSLISIQNAGQFYVNHRYEQASPKNGGYTINIKATDVLGNSGYLQFFAVVNSPYGANVIGSPKPPVGIASNKNWLLIAWPFYIIILMMVTSFWLGEREEFRSLYHHHLLRKAH